MIDTIIIEVNMLYSEPRPLYKIMNYLNYSGPISDSNEQPVQSVEIEQGCISQEFLFYQFLKQGFLVNLSPFFKGSYFRVRYYNYSEGKYWP
ncbi:MAG: hypothetical protein ACTSW1_04890 [Candidatus Hodarchaeales archaeon]